MRVGLNKYFRVFIILFVAYDLRKLSNNAEIANTLRTISDILRKDCNINLFQIEKKS